ncbi:hypothetical protein CC1G_12586 [Coprinopsis cinerea okayama7|uniref:Uncharacterized protein n=1 Tax=Coprinopsis cinerea (strain Okayama-7 / 130 / ATCC MYA-4618 / FGSC 9003) TaxID=240176 RepID=A8P6V1_COPC7|nr:hypothetical protein CC1G_12586 [Coprinopsis cinerea okayama7\|eukprot:XP_001839233.1 hypothetical protein CC1G_12586 [Coprinopsis cinerea okayama7\
MSKTKAQLKEQKREKNRRSYHKNKDSINARRRERYKDNKGATKQGKLSKPKKSESSPAAKATPVVNRPPETPVSKEMRLSKLRVHHACEKVRELGKRVTYLCGRSPLEFLETVCTNFISNRTVDASAARKTIAIHYEKFAAIRDQIAAHQATVLELEGISDSWRAIESLMEPVRKICNSLDEIECEAGIDADLLIDDFNTGELGFQKDVIELPKY